MQPAPPPSASIEHSVTHNGDQGCYRLRKLSDAKLTCEGEGPVLDLHPFVSLGTDECQHPASQLSDWN